MKETKQSSLERCKMFEEIHIFSDLQYGLPSGKRSHNQGKSSFVQWVNSSISMTIFNRELSYKFTDGTSYNSQKSPMKPPKSCWSPIFWLDFPFWQMQMVYHGIQHGANKDFIRDIP